LDLLRTSPVPLKPSEIAAALDKAAATIRKLLQKMKAAGDVIGDAQNRYTTKEFNRK